MSIVEGFAGFRIRNDKPSLSPKIPANWQAYRFKVNFRGQILSVACDDGSCCLDVDGTANFPITVNGQDYTVAPGQSTIIKL